MENGLSHPLWRTILPTAILNLFMGVYADDVNEFARTDEDEDSDRPPLGERLQGLASDLDIDSVAEVRELREQT